MSRSFKIAQHITRNNNFNKQLFFHICTNFVFFRVTRCTNFAYVSWHGFYCSLLISDLRSSWICLMLLYFVYMFCEDCTDVFYMLAMDVIFGVWLVVNTIARYVWFQILQLYIEAGLASMILPLCAIFMITTHTLTPNTSKCSTIFSKKNRISMLTVHLISDQITCGF